MYSILEWERVSYSPILIPRIVISGPNFHQNEEKRENSNSFVSLVSISAKRPKMHPKIYCAPKYKPPYTAERGGGLL